MELDQLKNIQNEIKLKPECILYILYEFYDDYTWDDEYPE